MTMQATYKKTGDNYLPAIRDSLSKRVIVMPGDTLATTEAAKKYAQIEINRFNHMGVEFIEVFGADA